jgi:hypothetical protein
LYAANHIYNGGGCIIFIPLVKLILGIAAGQSGSGKSSQFFMYRCDTKISALHKTEVYVLNFVDTAQARSFYSEYGS